MIRNRLSILLAEREITATEVSKETGISRTTLSSLVNNSGEGIQFKTLETLCRYLNIEPDSFFDFNNALIHYSDVELKSWKFKDFDDEYFFELPILVGNEEHFYRFNLFFASKDEEIIDLRSRFKKFDYYVDIEVPEDFLTNIYNDLSLAFKKETTEKILGLVMQYSNKIIKERFTIKGGESVSIDIESLGKLEFSFE